MFEKIARAAEKAADGVSRRDFLGRFGKAALATAAALGGVLALPGGALANRNSGTAQACCYSNNYPVVYCAFPGTSRVCTIVSWSCSGCVWNCSGKIVTTKCG
jgi:hypothetical protein